MEKAHSRINWENYPSIATPLNEANLNKMDKALDEVDNRVLGLDTAKLDKAVANAMVKEITFDEATGIFTITSLDGATKTIDTKLEKVATNFSYDYETQKLKLTLLDGTEQEIDMSTLISQYEFTDTSTIGFTVGNEGKITAIIKDGSVTEDKLQPNFLADIKVEVAKGKSYSDSSYENATTSSNASKEAKQYRDEAKQFRDEAQAMSGVEIATTEKAGLVKPDGTTIRVDEDGTIHADAGTVDYTELENKPSINGVELDGNKTLDNLGIASKTKVESLETELEKTTYKVDTVIAHTDLGIKETASGEEIHLTDSAEGKAVEFALFGKARQNTTSGKNLLPYPYAETTLTRNGITFTDNGDGTITANGTATENTPFELNNRFSLPEGNYILSGCPLGGSRETYSIYIQNYDFSEGAINNRDNEVSFASSFFTKDIRARIWILSGVKVENLVFKPMIRLASITDDTYEPYTNGASPNPQFPQPIEVSGESYNLIPYPYYETTHEDNGITWTDNNGIITANGTALADSFYTVSINAKVSANKEYIISGCPSGGSANTYTLRVTDKTTTAYDDIGNGIKFSYADISKFEVMIRIKAGYTANNLTFYPMIRKASVKNDRYMPFGVGSVEVKSVGKNLIHYPYYENKSGTGITWTDDNGIITANGTASGNNIRALNPRVRSLFNGSEIILKKGTYTLSDGLSNGSGTTYHVAINCYENGNDETSPQKTLATTYTNGTNTFEITEDDKLVWCYITIRDGYVANNLTFKPMLRLATDTDDTYQPYKETLSTIPTPNGLAGIKVSSGGNYTDQNGQQWICDEVVKYADGSGAYIQRIAKKVFDGVNNGSGWVANITGATETLTQMNLNIGDALSLGVYSVMCDKFKVDKSWTTDNKSLAYTCRQATSTGSCCCYLKESDGVTNGATANAWLQENNVTVYYILKEPITTPLTAEQLAEISTFYPITNISNDFDCGMSVKYNCDTKNYIDNKLALLTTAIVNNI